MSYPSSVFSIHNIGKMAREDVIFSDKKVALPDWKDNLRIIVKMYNIYNKLLQRCKYK